MADDNNQSAAASLPAAVPVRPVPLEDEVAKEVKELRRPLLPMQIKAPVANNNKTTTTTTPVVPAAPWCIHKVVFLWAVLNAVSFAGMGIATVILILTEPSCTTWMLSSCVTLTDEVDTELLLLLCGELLCSMVAELAAVAPLYMVRTGRAITTSRHWPAVVHALSWVALAATVGTHCCMKVTSDLLAEADPRNTAHVAFVGYICLALDLLAGVILCCSPRRLVEIWASISGRRRQK